MPISLSRRIRRLLAPTVLVHAAMASLTANARQQATWLWQSMHGHQMALWYDNWVKKNYGWTHCNVTQLLPFYICQRYHRFRVMSH